MDKHMTVTVSISTDPRTAHIGRYFVDIRDTTRDPNPVTARQLRTETHNGPGVLDLISQLRILAGKQGVRLTVKDATGGEINGL
jgi:hypothetical protein